jgi:hypothetical protein
MQGYKHDGTTVIPSWTITNIEENSNWLLVNDPCAIELGDGWRIPTNSEWENVDAYGNWWNWDGPWNSALKIHAAGLVEHGDGTLNFRGSSGFYWSNVQTDNSAGQILNIMNGYCGMGHGYKTYGFSVRCLKD